MLTIYKYPLGMYDIVAIKMPQDAKLLHVDVQRGQPCLWALVDPEKPLVDRYLRIAGTGHPIDQKIGKYVGTFFMEGGTLVFHVFDLTNFSDRTQEKGSGG